VDELKQRQVVLVSGGGSGHEFVEIQEIYFSHSEENICLR
jgi:hypothetical protein